MKGRSTMVIYGDLRDRGSGKLLAGRRVHLWKGGSAVETVRTNEAGRYYFTEMFWPRGIDAELRVGVDAGQSVIVRDFDVMLGLARADFEITQ